MFVSVSCRASPGGGAGTLTVVDNRTGKQYTIQVSDHGTIKATDLKKITAGGDGVGLRTFDNGCVLCGVRKGSVGWGVGGEWPAGPGASTQGLGDGEAGRGGTQEHPSLSQPRNAPGPHASGM